VSKEEEEQASAAAAAELAVDQRRLSSSLSSSVVKAGAGNLFVWCRAVQRRERDCPTSILLESKGVEKAEGSSAEAQGNVTTVRSIIN